jgi:hypothetical protein
LNDYFIIPNTEIESYPISFPPYLFEVSNQNSEMFSQLPSDNPPLIISFRHFAMKPSDDDNSYVLSGKSCSFSHQDLFFFDTYEMNCFLNFQ